ncbi:hypothetical protein [Roseococcus sp. SYP-B2431]|nr:hypothetical protein [Roseococcus sp. SYP-B2431]
MVKTIVVERGFRRPGFFGCGGWAMMIPIPPIGPRAFPFFR